MSAPSLLAAGSELTRWIRLGGRPDQVPTRVLWLYRWRSYWLQRSYELLCETGPAAQALAFPEGEGLIFIQGFWRTGSTLLHELLAEIPMCAVPRTWQRMEPANLLLRAERPKADEAIQRPMDQVMITADSPQEDEFALMAMGVPSVYRGFLDPRRLPELQALLQPKFWSENTDFLKALESFLDYCQQPKKMDGGEEPKSCLPNYRPYGTFPPGSLCVDISRSN